MEGGGGQTGGRGQETKGEGGLDGDIEGGLVILKATREASCTGEKLWIKECQPPSYLPSLYCDTSMSLVISKSGPVPNMAFILRDSRCLTSDESRRALAARWGECRAVQKQ